MVRYSSSSGFASVHRNGMTSGRPCTGTRPVHIILSIQSVYHCSSRDGSSGRGVRPELLECRECNSSGGRCGPRQEMRAILFLVKCIRSDLGTLPESSENKLLVYFYYMSYITIT